MTKATPAYRQVSFFFQDFDETVSMQTKSLKTAQSNLDMRSWNKAQIIYFLIEKFDFAIIIIKTAARIFKIQSDIYTEYPDKVMSIFKQTYDQCENLNLELDSYKTHLLPKIDLMKKFFKEALEILKKPDTMPENLATFNYHDAIKYLETLQQFTQTAIIELMPFSEESVRSCFDGNRL